MKMRYLVMALAAFFILFGFATSYFESQPYSTPTNCSPPPIFKQISAAGSDSRMGVFGLDETGKVWNKMSDGCWSQL